MDSLLDVHDLKAYFNTRYGEVKAVDGVSFNVGHGETVCLVGESGCGKTTAALSILRLLDSPPGRIAGGKIIYKNEDLLTCSMNRLREIRGNNIAMIFQDPMTSLNPVLKLGSQITEQIRLHLGLNEHDAMARSIELMEQVGIPRARERVNDYPHQFSGGMKQRVMIAAALSCNPEILIADEPTTALDTTVKAQILDIFEGLKKEKNMSILFITHDFGTVAAIADRVVVMYGGRVVETGPATDVFANPHHPYTIGLMKCLPNIEAEGGRLTPIPGTIPSLINPPKGCIFQPRCDMGLEMCANEYPGEHFVSARHSVFCHLHRT